MSLADSSFWLERIATLRCDTATGIAPHQPLLLLVVCDLAKEGKVETILNRNGDLAFRFSAYWTIVADRRRTRPDIRLPFYHIKTSGVWKPLDADGNLARNKDSAVSAQLDSDFLFCLNEPDFRALARRTLIAQYFLPNEKIALYELLDIETPPADIIAADAKRFIPVEESKRKRDAKFSVRVLPAYNYTCALTRYRMIAVDGTTTLDAAHIQQFKKGGSCYPTNGLALSKTSHWLFDRGFWSLDNDYKILVASHLFEESGSVANHLKPLVGTAVLLPENRAYLPDQDSLSWHREYHNFL